jgi:pimeloyl-ACP methyl ester carboxylesterase
MNLVAHGVLLHYRLQGKRGSPAILLLHGWGSSSQAFAGLAEQLGRHFCVISLDLPGFGGSGMPPSNWHISDYAKLVQEFLVKGRFEHLTAVAGHSFGGRVAIKAVGTGMIKPAHLVLMGSAGVRHSHSLRSQMFKALAKTGKVFTALPGLSGLRTRLRTRLYSAAGSSDYLNAGPLRQVFVNTINEDLQSDAAKIRVPSLLIWGDLDTETPEADVRLLAAKIPHSQFQLVDHAGHYVFQDQPFTVAGLIKDFLA